MHLQSLKPQLTDWRRLLPTVGASLLAKNLSAPLGVRLPASSFTTIASKLAPTGEYFHGRSFD